MLGKALIKCMQDGHDPENTGYRRQKDVEDQENEISIPYPNRRIFRERSVSDKDCPADIKNKEQERASRSDEHQLLVLFPVPLHDLGPTEADKSRAYYNQTRTY